MNFFYSSMPEALWIGNHRAALMSFNFIIWKVDQPVRADNEVSQNNSDIGTATDGR
jgi:hypothetical protein